LINRPPTSDQRLASAVLRLNGTVLGLALGTVGGGIIFVATNWLVLKGGDVVGPHLGLLAQFFWGYSVTFPGSIVGMFYGFIVGFVGGWLAAWVYNGVVFFRQKLLR
jgi:hypothetical protein